MLKLIGIVIRYTIERWGRFMAERLTAEGNTGKPEPALHETPGDGARARGKLKVFFSYAPGTGKTLAMLEDAYHRQQEGADVLAGFVDARGNMLAMQLL